MGTGLNTDPRYAVRSRAKIADETGLPFVTAPEQVLGLAGHDALVFASGACGRPRSR